ncbi:EamA family transporter [Candidatus Saccharibacteria bacterium]|nr:EamA family transporter [Candidatus Saccharibacteria bacterium]
MFYLMAAIVLFTAVSMFSAGASRRISPNLATLILNVFSIVAPLTIIAFAKAKDITVSTKSGLVMAVMAGLSVGLFGFFINKSYAINKVGVVTPVIFGGTILLSTILSYFIFKESLKGLEIAGLALILLGIGLIVYTRSVA